MAFISSAAVLPGGSFDNYRSAFISPYNPLKWCSIKTGGRVVLLHHLGPPSLSALRASISANKIPFNGIPANETQANEGRSTPDFSVPLSRNETIKHVLGFASPSRGMLFAALLAAFVFSLADMALPLVFGRVLDVVASLSTPLARTTPSLAASKLRKAICILIISYFGSSLLQMAETVLLKKSAAKIVSTIRNRLFSSLIRADIALLDSLPVSDFVSRLSTDTVVMQRVIADDVSKIIQGLTEVAVALTILFWLSAHLASILVICIPISLVAASLYGARTAVFAREFSSANANASATASEFLSGVRTIKAYTREEYAERTYESSLQNVIDSEIRSAWADGILRSWNKILFGLSSGTTFYFGGKLVMAGFMTVGAVVSSFIYASRINQSLAKLSLGVGEVLRSSGSIQRILRIVQTKPILECTQSNSTETDHSFSTKGHLVPMQGSIEFRNVWFQYPASERIVLRNINLQIPAGGNVAFVGKNGGGKSTMINLLLRFYDPVRGQVIIGGEDLRSKDIRYIRRNVIGVVDQEPFLVSGTLAGNIWFGWEDASAADVEDAARAVGVLDFARRFPNGLDSTIQKLSAGERQRVMIARCLIKRPKIVVFDESTSALDANSEALVSEAIGVLMRDPQITVILVSHRFTPVKYCDQIYVFGEGDIVERGNHGELLSRNGEYLRLFSVEK